MGYFNYHAKAKNLIRSGHLIGASIVQSHNKIAPALVLYFDICRPMPIRKDKWDDYFNFIEQYTTLKINRP